MFLNKVCEHKANGKMCVLLNAVRLARGFFKGRSLKLAFKAAVSKLNKQLGFLIG